MNGDPLWLKRRLATFFIASAVALPGDFFFEPKVGDDACDSRVAWGSSHPLRRNARGEPQAFPPLSSSTLDGESPSHRASQKLSSDSYQ